MTRAPRPRGTACRGGTGPLRAVRRRRTPCRRSGGRATPVRSPASDRRPAAPRARPSPRTAAARPTRTRQGDSGSGRRRASPRAAVASPANLPLPFDVLVERSTGAEEKRRLILDAAVRVFAHKGFHTSRVGDIAEEAGVAHGLLYHYFSSKDEVLDTIFREHWTALLDRVHAAEQSGDDPVEQLRGITEAMFRSWLTEPDVVRVVIREIARTEEISEHVGELVRPVGAIR